MINKEEDIINDEPYNIDRGAEAPADVFSPRSCSSCFSSLLINEMKDLILSIFCFPILEMVIDLAVARLCEMSIAGLSDLL